MVTKVLGTLGCPYTKCTLLYCEYFICCVFCNVDFLTCFVMCGCVCVGFVMCGCVGNSVGVLVTCVLVLHQQQQQ